MNFSVISKSALINAPADTVFTVLTCSEHIVNYFPVKEVISGWEQGDEILLKGEHNGEAFTDYGIIKVLSRPNEFSYCYWSDNHGTKKLPENYLTISYRLSPVEAGTKLEVIHSNLKSPEMFNIMNEVWDSLLDGLRQYINNLVN